MKMKRFETLLSSLKNDFYMETIEIKLSEYYDNPKYYACMPEVVFNALEAAFLAGDEVAVVPKSEFEEMIYSYSK